MRLGKSDLSVPVISLGTNNFGVQVDRSVSFKILDTAFDLGINMIDTADIYTKGKSEEILGEWAKGRRNDIIIATKVGMEPLEEARGNLLSKSNILFQLEGSLKRLQSDYIDLYYVHQFDEQTPLKETLATLDGLVKENKIRHVACSNFSASQVSEALKVCEKEGFGSFIANQVRYNIFQREIESDSMPFCSAKSIGIVAYSPLRSGLLAGRYARGVPPPAGSRGNVRGQEYLSRLATEENFQRLEKLKTIAKESNLSLPVLAISWILQHGSVSSAIAGASTPEQLKETSKAASTRLSPRTMDLINTV
ncbi:MAG TPA: aldo/keto reductase [Nitrososphaerales archaeon]|nr:aldo/keto reductase [Nitrososphaerales archaeon]